MATGGTLFEELGFYYVGPVGRYICRILSTPLTPTTNWGSTTSAPLVGHSHLAIISARHIISDIYPSNIND